jgi:hypothetical protein
MRRALGWVAVPFGLGLAACFTSPDQQQVQTTAGCSTSTCTKATTGRTTRGGNGSSSSSSSGGAGGSSSGGGTGGSTTGGGNSGGSAGNTGGQVCGTVVACGGDPASYDACLTPLSCPGAICTQVCDELSQTGVCGLTVRALDVNGLPIPGVSQTTQLDGTVQLCPPAQTFTISAGGQGYVTTYTAQLMGNTAATTAYFDNYGNEIPIFSTTNFEELVGVFHATTSDAIVGASIFETTCGLSQGFDFSVEIPDGGALADGGALPFSVEYLQGNLPDPTATQTDDAGSGFLAFDATVFSGSYVAVTAEPVDLAAGCDAGSRPFAQFGMTGLVYVQPGAFSSTAVPIGW